MCLDLLLEYLCICQFILLSKKLKEIKVIKSEFSNLNITFTAELDGYDARLGIFLPSSVN